MKKKKGKETPIASINRDMAVVFLLELVVHGNWLLAQGTQPEDMPCLRAVFFIEIVHDRRIYLGQYLCMKTGGIETHE